MTDDALVENQMRGEPPSRCAFPSCDCPGETPACEDYEQTNDDYLLGQLYRDSRSVCIVHLVPEPCPTCRSYIAAGL